MAEIKLPQAWQDWHITEELGEGAYGRVYRAEKENGGVTAVSAIKVIQVPSERAELLSLRREFASEEELRRNLKAMVDEYANEIRAMYRLQGHTHIVSIQDHVVEELNDGAGWRIYIRMEYLQPFDDYAMTHTFSGKEIIRLGISLCEALSVCAEHGILHRDIKPENLFVTENGQFKLGDFGIAKALDRTVSAYSSKGTFSFMAPEVFHGKPYDSRADLYSTGIILYKLANRNRDPFIDPEKQIITHQDREQAMSRRMQGEKLPAPADADEKLAKVILKACEFNPQDRYNTPDVMMRALKELLLETAPAAGKPERKRTRRTEKKPVKAWILPVCAAILLLIAGVAVLLNREGGNLPDAEKEPSAGTMVTAESGEHTQTFGGVQFTVPEGFVTKTESPGSAVWVCADDPSARIWFYLHTENPENSGEDAAEKGSGQPPPVSRKIGKATGTYQAKILKDKDPGFYYIYAAFHPENEPGLCCIYLGYSRENIEKYRDAFEAMLNGAK